MNSTKVFFENAQTLAKLFTPENCLSYEQNKWFGDEFGCKAIESFDNDIYQNLVEWAAEGKSIYYRTKKYLYVYTRKQVSASGGEVIECTRFDRDSWRRWDTWMNIHSCGVGKEFLKNHKDKKVALFHQG